MTHIIIIAIIVNAVVLFAITFQIRLLHLIFGKQYHSSARHNKTDDKREPNRKKRTKPKSKPNQFLLTKFEFLNIIINLPHTR